MKTKLYGLNIDLLTNIMAIYGIKHISEGKFNCWCEVDGCYGTISCFCDIPDHQLVDKIYSYLKIMVEDTCNGKYTPSLKTFYKDGKNIFMPPTMSGSKNQVKTITRMFSVCPDKEYIEQTIFHYPYIQYDENLSPITFAEENQRQDYKFGLKSSSKTLNCNRVIQMLMWIGIENYLDFHEVNKHSEIVRMGEYIVNSDYKKSSKGKAIILYVPVTGKCGSPIREKKYRRETPPNSSYHYWTEV
jgi:hypothetical protein